MVAAPRPSIFMAFDCCGGPVGSLNDPLLDFDFNIAKAFPGFIGFSKSPATGLADLLCPSAWVLRLS
jgi:hypothetical protein